MNRSLLLIINGYRGQCITHAAASTWLKKKCKLIYFYFFLNGESQTKIFAFLQMDGAGAADGFVGFINYSSSLGSCEQMGIQVCQVGRNYLFNHF